MRLLSSNLLLILAASASVTALVGCGEAKPSWDCQATNVPMGKTIECTSSTSDAVTYDGDSTSVGFGDPVATSDGTAASGSGTGAGTSDGAATGGSG
ncbi:MAG: hypothetical protein JWM74_5306, partial [Myxococcaceae bacterium]|nr:hypothetical protein [Myxococcaceae bacterium]